MYSNDSMVFKISIQIRFGHATLLLAFDKHLKKKKKHDHTTALNYKTLITIQHNRNRCQVLEI